jgi:hypothetical protein
MMSWLGNLFFNVIYVQIKSDWISIRAVGKGKRFEDIPVVAIDGNSKVLAVGKSAEAQQSEKVTLLRMV